MKKLSKFDVMLYLAELNNPDRNELLGEIRKNAFFEGISNRVLAERLNELKREELIRKKELALNYENPKTPDIMAFLYWSKMRNIDYNLFLDERVVSIFRQIFENSSVSIAIIMKKTRLSKPTILKIIKILRGGNFINISRKKRLLINANLNDITFFHVNIHRFSFSAFQKRFTLPVIKEAHSKKIKEQLIRLHTYSTTVTEGNTATERDIDRIFNNYPVDLTPREITEILNAKIAVDEIYKIRSKEVDIYEIKRLHGMLMNNLIEEPGEFHYGRKRIIGSLLNPPESKEEIDSSISALMNFYKKYKKEMNPHILGPITHFIFVTIHPFVDGNGRIARLIHSWIFLNSNLPLFVFDPQKRNMYFDALENGRKNSIDDFINFCISEQYNCIKGLRE